MAETLPHGWGLDSITKHIDAMRHNQKGTFEGLKNIIEPISVGDAALLKLINGANNPQHFFSALLFIRALASQRAAAACALAGHAYEVSPLVRSSLELCGYAHLMAQDTEAVRNWLSRHKSPQSLEEVKRAFTVRKVKASINKSAPKIGGLFDRLYERAIDYGAHPNERGFSLSFRVEKKEDVRRLQTVILHGDAPTIAVAISYVGHVTLCILLLARLLWPVRCELLGVSEEIDKLRDFYNFHP